MTYCIRDLFFYMTFLSVIFLTGAVYAEEFLCLSTEDCEVVADSTPHHNNIHISLFQSEQEKKELNHLKKEYEDNKKEHSIPIETAKPVGGDAEPLIVTGIFYTSPQVWSVWVGHRVYNQDQCRLDDVLGEETTIQAKNSSVVDLIKKGKSTLVFLGQSLR